MTPEAKVKHAVKKIIAEFPGVYSWWPVPSGFGESSLDCIICINKFFLAIETKAPGKKPTPRQETCIHKIQLAGGAVLVIDSVERVGVLRSLLERLAARAE